MKKHTCKKVFISSTCFDLKDLRAELAISLKEWGYTPIWNESPDFPKKPGLHSHDQCLDVVENCDIYLLIIDNPGLIRYKQSESSFCGKLVKT